MGSSFRVVGICCNLLYYININLSFCYYYHWLSCINFKSKFCCITVTKPKGYRMVPRKTWVLENFGPISKAIVIGLKVTFLGDFASRSESQICSVSVLNFETWVSQYLKFTILQQCVPLNLAKCLQMSW